MISATVAKRYTKGIYIVAKEKGLQNKVRDDLKLFCELIANKQILTFLCNPVIHAAAKIEPIKEATKNVFHPLSIYFISYIISNNRAGLANLILDHYEGLLLKDNHLVKVTLHSFKKPTPETIDRVKSAFKGVISDEIAIDVVENKSLLGGHRLFYKDNLIDFSLAGRLDKMSELLSL